MMLYFFLSRLRILGVMIYLYDAYRLTITIGLASTAIQSGFKPRFEKYFKKFELG